MNLTPNDVILIALGIFSLITGILGFFGSWAFLKTINLGEDVATLKTQIQDGDRRFRELKESLDRLHIDLQKLNESLQEAVFHWPKRGTDKS